MANRDNNINLKTGSYVIKREYREVAKIGIPSCRVCFNM